MIGWIKLHREIQSNVLWNEKPFSKGQAWIDLLLLASHKDTKFLLGNEMMELEQGSFITSEIKLMERWGWSKSKVRAFLLLLQNEKMLIKKTDQKKTTLSIVNYRVYQDSETTERPVKDHKKTSKRPVKDTIKNDKNDKNIYIYSKNSSLSLSFDEYEKLKNKYGLELVDKKIEQYKNWVSDRYVKPDTDVYKTLNGWCNKDYKQAPKTINPVKVNIQDIIENLKGELQ